MSEQRNTATQPRRDVGLYFAGPEYAGGVKALARALNLDFSFFGNNLILPRDYSEPEKRHAWTYAVLKQRAMAVSSVPVRIYTGDRKDKVEAENHPLQTLFDRPNPVMSSALFWRMWMRLMDTKGYALVLLDPFAKSGEVDAGYRKGAIPREMWVQDADQFRVIYRTSDGKEIAKDVCEGLYADSWRIVAWVHKSKGWRFTPEQVLFYEAPEGAPLRAARLSIDGDFAAARYAKKWVENDCNPSGWYEIEQWLTDEERRQFREARNQETQGPENAGKFMLLEGGIKWTPNPQTMRDMQWLEGRDHWLDEICAVFGVPKAILNIGDDAKYSNHLSQVRVFMEQTIFPIHREIEDFLWTQLLSNVEGGRYWVEFDASGIPALQSDIADRILNASNLWGKGYSRNELSARFNLGFEEDEETGDIRLVQAGMLPADEVSLVVGGEMGELDGVPAEDEPEKLTPEQVTAILAIVSQVSAGTLPPESAKAALKLGYPLSDADINALIDPASKDAEQSTPTAGTSDDPSGDQSDPKPESDEDEEEDDGEDAESDDERHISCGGPLVGEVKGRRYLLSALKRRAILRERANQKAREDWERFRRQEMRGRERTFATKLTKAFMDQKAEIMRQVEAKLKRAGVLWNVRMSDQKSRMTPDDLAQIGLNEARWNERFRDIFIPVYKDMLERTGRFTAAQIKGDGLVFNAANPKWIDFINRRVGDKLVGVNSETIDAVRRAIRKSLFDGETPTEMMARLRTLPQFSRARARTVAQTEMGYTVNQTKNQQFDEFQIDEVIWVVANPSKARDSHLAAEAAGKRRKGEPFPNGLRWPYDETGPAEEVINCGCSLAPALDYGAN